MLFSLRGNEGVKNWDKVPFGIILIHPVVMAPRSNCDSKPLCSVSPNICWKVWARERLVDMRGEGSDMRMMTNDLFIIVSSGYSWLSGPEAFTSGKFSPPSALAHVKWSDMASNCICIRVDVLTWHSLHLRSPAALDSPRFMWLLCVVSERSNVQHTFKTVEEWQNQRAVWSNPSDSSGSSNGECSPHCWIGCVWLEVLYHACWAAWTRLFFFQFLNMKIHLAISSKLFFS